MSAHERQPEQLDKTDLLAVLDEIRAGVESGDTLEGRVEFTLAEPGPGPWVGLWDVRALYRVGNLQGQDSYRSIGTLS